ncbi:hypothetical protein G6L45_16055 [Agrobacterium rhizogenes]|nr:hypothetical protein [Rhizobium rhizogenes]NTH96999.1 hypothetical protein [Rhizobium rhizogenes]NTJ15185.1 hypothetical protein [Rhizobium rhizogenes]
MSGPLDWKKEPLWSLYENKAELELEHKRRDEARTAAAQAFHAVAYISMPEDLKSRAVEWGVSALMEAVWMNAFECGYKQSIRDASAGRAALADEGGREKP